MVLIILAVEKCSFAKNVTFYGFVGGIGLRHDGLFTLARLKNWRQDMSAINDPLGQTHSPASSDHYSHLKVVVLRDFEKWGADVHTDSMCDNSDHYRP